MRRKQWGKKSERWKLSEGYKNLKTVSGGKYGCIERKTGPDKTVELASTSDKSKAQ